MRDLSQDELSKLNIKQLEQLQAELKSNLISKANHRIVFSGIEYYYSSADDMIEVTACYLGAYKTTCLAERLNISLITEHPEVNGLYLPFCRQLTQAKTTVKSPLTNLDAPMCKSIPPKMFLDNYTDLAIVNLPSCTYIGESAFEHCKGLEKINITSVQVIENYAFCHCHVLEELDLPECIYIGEEAFACCNILVRLNLPKCKVLDARVTYGTKLQELNLPEVIYMGINNLSCPVSKLIIPKCTILEFQEIISSTYQNQNVRTHYSLEYLYAPKCVTVTKEDLRLSYTIQKAVLPNLDWHRI